MFVTRVISAVIIILMNNLTRSESDSSCFEVYTSQTVYYNGGGNVTLEVGIDPDPVKLVCQQTDSTVNQGFYANFAPCAINSNSFNITEEDCGANCLAYVIRPTTVGCVELMCQRGTNSSSTLTKTCYMQVHIKESSTSPTRIYNSTESNGSLEVERPSNMGTIMAIVAVIAVAIIILIVAGIVIYLCYKNLKSHHRWPPDKDPVNEENQIQIVGHAIVDDEGKRNDSEVNSSDATYVTEVVSPEDEKCDSTSFAIITTRTERSNRHYKTQRSYESGCVGNSAEDEIQRSVKYTSNQLGEVNDNMGDESVEHYCQETNKDSTACFTMADRIHYPNGNVNPERKSVLYENEVKNCSTNTEVSVQQ